MVINKILGALVFIIGGFVLFSMWYTADNNYNMFGFQLITGPLLVYLGLWLMGYL